MRNNGIKPIAARAILLATTIVLLVPGPVVEATFDALSVLIPWLASNDGEPGLWTDKIIHLVLFLACGLSSALAWQATARVMVGLLLYGATTELLQGIIPGRGASIADFMADALGAGLGIGFAVLVSRSSPATSQTEQRNSRDPHQRD